MRRFIILVGIGCMMCTLVSPVASAQDGLEVSSSRIEMTARPGDARAVSYTVTNNSTRVIEVRVQIKQFAVDPRKETIKFTSLNYDWVTPQSDGFSLEPNQKKPVRFSVTIPKNAASREYNFALIASTSITSGGTTKTLQVAPLFYLYVEGLPVDRTSIITADTRPGFTLSSAVPYAFDLENKGNIHLESQVSVALDGLAWHHDGRVSQKLILPGQSRTVTGSIAAPRLPGLYTLTYSSLDSMTGHTITSKRPVLVVPPWTISALILIVLLIIWGWQLYRKRAA